MRCYPKTIADIKDMYKNNQIELDPPYQRKPVWKTKQRTLLLSSLFNGIPIPALIFHKHFRNNREKYVYDVLDGKQRLETILHFIDLKEIKGEDQLWVGFINPKTNKIDYLYYDELRSKKVNKEYENLLEKFLGYEIPIIEYQDDLTDFFDRNVASKEVFVRINSTGSPLKKHEIRHALHVGQFFELGNILERKYEKLFLEKWKVISKTDIERYLFHEFILELCTACHLGEYSDRRRKLDEFLSPQYKWTVKETEKVRKAFNRIILWLKDIFPNESIKFTRFRNKSDFYSLFVVLHKLAHELYVTTDRKSNKLAGRFLLKFSKQIQKLDRKVDIKKIHQLKLTEPERKLYPYIASTRQATDSKRHRELRDTYIMSILKDGFFLRSKDSKRTFDQNVKDILWVESIEKSEHPKCPNPTKSKKCKGHLTYEDSQVDHRYPWSKGGLTNIDNAQLICSSCNSSKGNR